jgi:hypothetical protein
MNDRAKTGPSIWERSNFVRTIRWLCSWRGIRRVAIVLAWSATIIGLWYGEENWRGRRAWNQYREATEARGESLDFASYIPKDVPENQNFAATPLLKSFMQPDFQLWTNDFYARAIDTIADDKISKDKGRRHFLDLAAWEKAAAALESGQLKRKDRFETDNSDLAGRAAAAPAILEEMKADEATFAELRAASNREFSRYSVHYNLENPWSILLPHLAKVKGVCQRLNLQACAELAAGQSDKALADVKLVLALADSIKTEPFIISILVRVSCVEIAIQPVWEGLAEHRWTDAQLQELQSGFSSYDFLTDAQKPLLSERACGVLVGDIGKKSGQLLLDAISDFRGTNESAFFLVSRVMPSGWFSQEKVNFGTLFDLQQKGVVDLVARTISPSKARANSDALIWQTQAGSFASPLHRILHHRVLAALMLPALNNFYSKPAMAQVAVEQAALACALERYRVAKGQFPETLEGLTPPFMSRRPNDVITGQPYKYRRTDDGKFILYSVGWNEKDDGGAPGTSLFDQTQGDWVWSYPAG